MTKVKQNMEISKTGAAGVVNAEFTTQDLQTLFQAGIIPDRTPPQQVKVFARVCAEKGLSPFSKQIYLVNYGNKYSIITGIDGFRSLAARTGLYAGADPAQFNRTAKGQWFTAADLVASGKKIPVSCSFTVYKIVGGQRVPFTAECLFDEYAGRAGGNLAGKWKTMPYNMIAKCAEAKAYKMAFPEQMSGMHIPEEQAAFEESNTGMSAGVPISENEEEREELIEQVRATIEHLDINGLKKFYENNPMLVDDPEILALLTERKNQIKNG